MPGSYRNGDGQARPGQAIESLGAIKVSLVDAADNRLNLKAGSTATIRIPLASRSSDPPTSIPLFYLDEITGRWMQQGSATLKGDATPLPSALTASRPPALPSSPGHRAATSRSMPAWCSTRCSLPR